MLIFFIFPDLHILVFHIHTSELEQVLLQASSLYTTIKFLPFTKAFWAPPIFLPCKTLFLTSAFLLPSSLNFTQIPTLIHNSPPFKLIYTVRSHLFQKLQFCSCLHSLSASSYYIHHQISPPFYRIPPLVQLTSLNHLHKITVLTSSLFH